MNLKDFFEENRKVALAFSGGVDSVFLMYMAKHYGIDVKAYFIDSPFQTDEDRNDAKKAAKLCSCEIEFIYEDVLSDERISSNSPKRCYFCKRHIFETIKEHAAKDEYDVIIDGSNASDSFDDRPGMVALRELGVLSPLRICGLSKDEIREKSKELELFTWDKPSNSCLATRIETGSKITKSKLEAVEKAESRLGKLGFSDFRVRHMGEYFLVQLKEDQFEKASKNRKDITDALITEDIDKIYLDLKER